MTFKDFALKSELIQAVGEIGFETATPIQERVIPCLLDNNVDLTALAQTGTGKTAAFGLPILNSVQVADRAPQALVICPTRELCVQIAGDLESYGKYIQGLAVTAVYGGDRIDRQIRALRGGSHIIVATPGRLLDLLNRGVVKTGGVRFLVLDEADIMLNMGFKDEMDAILAEVPEERRTVLLSATMSAEVARIAARYMKEPVEISAGARNSGAANVEHGHYMVHARDKYLALRRIVDFHPDMYAIVFCRTRAATQEVAGHMVDDGYNAEALHGEMAQAQRDMVMGKFRQRSLQILVATDIAARGLDVDDITHVIHYDLPDEPEVYTHRSGRTGRAGKSGVSLSIINLREKYKLKRIEQAIKARIPEKRVPSGEEICERQLMHRIDRVSSVEVDAERMARYLPVIEERLAGLSRTELLAQFVSFEFNGLLDYYRSAPELMPVGDIRSPGRRTPRGSFRRDVREGDFVSLVLNVGRRARVQAADVIGIVNRATPGDKVDIGRIDIGDYDTRVQIESGSAAAVLSSVREQTFHGRKIRAEQQNWQQYEKPPGRPGGQKIRKGRR